MTPKLMDRLDRLERSHANSAAPQGMPPELQRAWILTVAFTLGGYPRDSTSHPPYTRDTISDGFARGLGYRDGADVVVEDPAHLDNWRVRLDRAGSALSDRYGASGVLPKVRAFCVTRGVLEDVSRMRQRI